jgi:AcrR family transcriptional regulator
MDQPRPAAKRADAERNREAILAVARSAFAEPGGARTSMAEIARRAGVGMATLYRNFPGRRELLEALYLDEVDAIVAAAAESEGDTPGAVLTAWLVRFSEFFTSKRDIAAELLTHTDEDAPIFSDNRARVLAAGRPLLDAARAGGEVRDDLTLEQIIDMVHALAAISGDPDYSGAILRVALDGLRVATNSAVTLSTNP